MKYKYLLLLFPCRVFLLNVFKEIKYQDCNAVCTEQSTGDILKIMTLGTDLRPIKSASLGVVPGTGGFLSFPR